MHRMFSWDTVVMAGHQTLHPSSLMALLWKMGILEAVKIGFGAVFSKFQKRIHTCLRGTDVQRTPYIHSLNQTYFLEEDISMQPAHKDLAPKGLKILEKKFTFLYLRETNFSWGCSILGDLWPGWRTFGFENESRRSLLSAHTKFGRNGAKIMEMGPFHAGTR